MYTLSILDLVWNYESKSSEKKLNKKSGFFVKKFIIRKFGIFHLPVPFPRDFFTKCLMPRKSSEQIPIFKSSEIWKNPDFSVKKSGLSGKKSGLSSSKISKDLTIYLQKSCEKKSEKKVPRKSSEIWKTKSAIPG